MKITDLKVFVVNQLYMSRLRPTREYMGLEKPHSVADP